MPLDPNRALPSCVGGSRAAPPEDCAGALHYLKRLDRYRSHLPIDELNIKLRSTKGNHTLSVRTVFGQLTVRSPRLHHCACQPHETKTFSPLAEILPNHTLPELLFLETKWASLMSYGMTSKLLQEVLPMDEPVNSFTIRQHVADVAERLERELGDEPVLFHRGLLEHLGPTSRSRWSADGRH